MKLSSLAKSAAGFAANLKTIAGEGTAIGKAAAVAETTINTYKAATGAYASLASIPYVGPALGAAAAAAAVVAGLANVKKILAVQNPNGGDKATGNSAGSAVSVPRASYNPEIGKGLVSRDNATGTQSSVASGVQQGINAAPVQPVFVRVVMHYAGDDGTFLPDPEYPARLSVHARL